MSYTLDREQTIARRLVEHLYITRPGAEVDELLNAIAATLREEVDELIADREAEGRELGPALTGMPEMELEEPQGVRAARCIERLKCLGVEMLKHAGEAYVMGFKDGEKCEQAHASEQVAALKKMLDGVRDIIGRHEQHHPSEFGSQGTEVLYDLRSLLGRIAPDHLPPIGSWQPTGSQRGPSK